MSEPFHFYTKSNLIKLLGIKAKNTIEMLECIKKISASSIYYHTHRFLQQHQQLCPEPPNDFAYWLKNTLNLKELAESLECVDIITFRNLEDLREEFTKILTKYNLGNKNISNCSRGEEFHFMSYITFVFPTPYTANTLTEFAEILGKISINSLYFHIFDARMRLEKDENDFMAWFKGLGENKLAEEFTKFDPYTITLEGLRNKFIKAVNKYAKH